MNAFEVAFEGSDGGSRFFGSGERPRFFGSGERPRFFDATTGGAAVLETALHARSCIVSGPLPPHTLPHLTHVNAFEVAFEGSDGGASGAGTTADSTFLSIFAFCTRGGDTIFRIFLFAFRVFFSHARMCEDLPGVFFEKCFPQCGQSSAFPARETGFFTASLDTRRCGF